ncbi:MAG: DegT/DnrJ/EryC1/StrS family aminotransferase [Cytophagales bacterium]
MQVPFYPLELVQRPIRGEIDRAIARVLDEGNFVLGEQVKLFEKEFADFVGVKHCITVGNGLDALTIALKAKGIGLGDEVLVPSHTCQATWLSVVRTGAKPVGVEVNGFLIDPTKIESFITKRSKAIMPVHLYGYPCHMGEIQAVADRYGLTIIEDFAQAQGACWNGKQVGSLGDVNGTSFYPTKNLGALGDGGAITTNVDEVAAFARSYRNYGSLEKDIHVKLGMNSRLDEVQAAVLRVKLKYLTAWNEHRTKLAELYFSDLQSIGEVVLPPIPTFLSKPVFHQFVVQTKERDSLRDFLSKAGIGTAIHYPTTVYLQQAYSLMDYIEGSFPLAECLSKCVLSLPIWPNMPEQQAEWVAERIKEFFNR